MRKMRNGKILIIIITIIMIIFVGNNMCFAVYGDDDAVNEHQQDGKISGKDKDEDNQDITGQGVDEEIKAQQGKDPREATKTPTPTPTPKKTSSSGKTSSSSGTSSTDLSWDSIVGSANKWLNDADTLIPEGDVANKVLPIGQMLTAIGVAILFGGIIIIGIKYMISEPEQKGKLKQQLIGIVVAGVVIFGAYTIWNLFYNFFTNLFK